MECTSRFIHCHLPGVNNTKNVNPTSVVPHTIMEVLTCMHGFFYDKLFVVTCMHGLGFNREV